MNTPAISVIVVNWRSYDQTAACVRAIADGTQAQCEFIIIDNSADMQRRSSLHDSLAGLPVRWSFNDRNVGFAAANNMGVGLARAPFVLLINPDTAVSPGSVDALLAILNRRRDVGLLGSQLLNPDGSLQTSHYAVFPSLAGSFLDAFGLLSAFRLMCSLGGPGRSASDLTYVRWIKGAVMLMRTDTFRALGGFDLRFFMYAEDADLCRRIRDAGLKVAVARNVRICHYGGQSAAFAREESVRAYYAAYLAFVAKHYGYGWGGSRVYVTDIFLHLAAATRSAALYARSLGTPDRVAQARAYWAYARASFSRSIA